MSHKPFKRQQESIDKMYKFVGSKTSKKGLFVYPVAYGKSIVIAHVAMKFPEKYFINICPNKELTEQNHKRYCSYGYEASICSASLGKNEIGQVTFATIGTLKKHLEFFKDKEVVILNDECFSYNTPIVTEAKGVEKIGNIVKYFKQGKKFKVKSYNENTKEFEYKKVLNVFERGEKEVYRTYFHSALSIESTLNHRLLTLDGWKEIADLKKGDAIISSYKQDHNTAFLNLNEDQKAIVIGSSLGDGNIDIREKGSNCARLKMIQGESQKDYLYWKASMFYKEKTVELIPENGFSKKPAYRFTTNSFYLKESHKTYEWQIENLCNKSLAILWMDDGSKNTDSNYGSLYSMADSKKYSDMLCEKLKTMGYDVENKKLKSSSTGKPYYKIIFKEKEFRKLSDNISKYVRSEFAYKLHTKSLQNLNTYIWNNKEGVSVKIFKGSEYKGIEKTYDIEVEDNHNFLVAPLKSYKTRRLSPSDKRKTTMEGIVAHNCQNSALKGSQLDKFIRGINKVKVIGTTATPVRLDSGMTGSSLKMMNRMRKCFYSSIEDVVQVSEVIENKRWSKLIYEVEDIDESSLELNTTGTEYTLRSLKNFSDDNNIIDKAKTSVERLLEEGRKSVLVYMPFIEDAEKLTSKIKGAEVLHSKVSNKHRTRVIEDFKSGKIKVLINCLILVEGFDYPELSSIIMCRPTNSINQYYQAIGRGTRVHKNKKDCKIVDISGNFNKFGRIEGLTYEEVPYYGWGMFNEKGELLTDYPLKSKYRPTKESLIKNGKKKEKQELEKAKQQKEVENPIITFGMWKGRKVWDIARNIKDAKRFKNWCEWFMKEQEKPSPYPKNYTLINAINKYLKKDAEQFNMSNLFK